MIVGERISLIISANLDWACSCSLGLAGLYLHTTRPRLLWRPAGKTTCELSCQVTEGQE